MIIFCTLITRVILTWRIKAVNPVKTRVAILSTGVILMLLSSHISGSSWIPILILILFMGGIIIIFIILSSILPNEPRIKLKNPLTYLLTLVVVVSIISLPLNSGGQIIKTIRAFLLSGQNFYIIISLIFLYFVGSIRILRTEQTPIRVLSCL